MFDINGGEFLLLLVVAVVVIGPERLPRYAAQLGAWVRTLRGFLRTAKERVDEELGDQAGDVDWTALDPRRYDPRRIVREALLDDTPVAPTVSPSAARAYTSSATPVAAANGGVAGAAVGGAAVGGAVADAAVADERAAAPVEAVAEVAPYDDEAT